MKEDTHRSIIFGWGDFWNTLLYEKIID
jgi:hypothetical protein